MRGSFCRGLRLEWMAGLMALAMPAMAMAVVSQRGVATETALTAETHDRASGTEAAVTVAVAGEDGLPAVGAVEIEEHGRQLAGAALNADGRVSLSIHLPAGPDFAVAIVVGALLFSAARAFR